MIVVDADVAARAEGAHPGLPSAHSPVVGLLAVEHDPAGDASAQKRIALLALRHYCPWWPSA